MNLIYQIMKWFNGNNNQNKTIRQLESNNLSTIDIPNLKINRNLTEEESNSRNKLFEEISSGNFSTFISYTNGIAKQINYYMDIVRKRLNQNIEQNQSISRNITLEQAIRQKVQIIFNNAEIDSILDNLTDLKRKCELRIIALEDLGDIELKKSKKKIFFFGGKTDENKIVSINNTIMRLSAQINILNMLTTSIKNEQEIYMNENYSLDLFIDSNNSEESYKIANRVIFESFEELKKSITSISTFSNVPSLVFDDVPIDKLDIDKMTLDKKVEVVALTKKYLDLYVAQNRDKLLSKGGLLDRAREYQNKLWEEIESDYLDVPLWAKKVLDYMDNGTWETIQTENRFFNRYHSRIEIFEKLISVFGEEIPEDFKEKFYKTKFYYYALYNETNNCDSFKGKPFEIKNEEERIYYLKFITEIVDKIHRKSDDGDLLNFMDKHLSLKNPDDILDKYYKLTSLLRIEKFGRDGLFTLIFYLHEFENNLTLQSCLDQIDSKNFEKLKIMPDDNSHKMAKDILKLWKSTNNLEKMYNGFWGDYNDGWKFTKKIDDSFYPRSKPEIYGLNFQIEYIEFLVKTIKECNNAQRGGNVALEDRFFFDPELNIKLHSGQYIAMASYLIERLTKKDISKETALAQIQSAIATDKDKLSYSNILRKILPDLKEYMQEKLSDNDYKYLYGIMSKDYTEGKINAKKSFINLLFKNHESNTDKSFDYGKYKNYKSIINLCESFYKLGIDGWTLTFMCLKLDKDFGMENIRDELLANYHINQTIDDSYYHEEYTLNMYNAVNGLRCICSDRVYDDINLESFNDCIEFFILNRLTDKDVLKNEEDFRIASYIAHYYRDVLERLWKLQINIR